MTLEPLPHAPDGVKYALTVPQSVLFADISLRGNRREAFEQVFGTPFELQYVVIDDGAMSWDYRGDADAVSNLCGTLEPVAAIRRFISAMGATARAVERTSWILASPSNRRADHIDDLMADLKEYWDAYERHMTSLFTFWNIEDYLSTVLVDSLREFGLQSDVHEILQRFLQPSETNYFALERRHLSRVVARFGPNAGVSEAERDAALEHHVQTFGFLLAPFNLGSPPSVSSIHERLNATVLHEGPDGVPFIDLRNDMLADMPERVRELGLLAQELTYWKTERLDVMALGDAQVAPLYRAAADALSIPTEHLFVMRRDEIESSLLQHAPTVSEATRTGRLEGYCLLLRDGAIAFYQPSRQPDNASSPTGDLTPSNKIQGTPTSPGVASGRVRLISTASDTAGLENGDILVAAMTRPEMGVALDRAAAFVTDEGGRMCHAAIISREMQKPCITGTGVATQRLRDGMTVVVDGTKGIVTIADEHDGQDSR